MKTFVISAIVGAAIIGMHGVTAMLGAEAAAIPAPDAGPLDERQVIADGGCWQISTGEVRCPAYPKHHPGMEKRQVIADGGCWQISTGEVRCPYYPKHPPRMEERQVIADGGCRQTADGKVYCEPAQPPKPQPPLGCYEGSDGESHCEEPPPKEKRQIIADGGCRQTADGKVYCEPAQPPKPQPPQPPLGCYEGSDGESHCEEPPPKEKRDVATGTATSIAPAQTSGDTTGTWVDSSGMPCWSNCTCWATGRTCTGSQPRPWDQGFRNDCRQPPYPRTCGYPEGREDARCGLEEFDRATCDPQGRFGGCCSSHGWCGNTTDHCGAGCLSGCPEKR